MNLTVKFVNGTTREVDVIVADRVAFSETRGKRKWPTLQEDPDLAATFWAFAACRREGVFSGSFDQFTVEAAEVDVTPTPDEYAQGLPDPTQTGTLPG